MDENGLLYEKANLRTEREKTLVKVYRRRWIIIIIHMLLAALSCVHWIEYSIINNVVMKYYHVSSAAVDWTSITFAIVWPILIFPACFIIDKMGLRVAALIGTLLTAIGAGIKLFSIEEHLFYVVMIGQIVIAISQIFLLSLPPKIAVTWFKPQEISTVCSLGIFGMAVGCAMGFCIPPIIVKDSDNLEEIGQNLKIMCWGPALGILPVALAVVFYFPAEPPCPPSLAMLEERENREVVTFSIFMGSIKTLMKSKPFLLQIVCFSCNVGISSSIGTLLNQLVLSYFPGSQEDAGKMGLVMVITGTVASVSTGFVLDKTHRYKETAFIILLLCTFSTGGLALAMEMKIKWMTYVAIGFFGFFLSAYMPAGTEFATELTFPSPESTVFGLLIASSQVLTVILTVILGIVMETFGSLICILTMAAFLACGTILTAFTPNKLKRQAAFMKGKNLEFAAINQ